MLNKDEVPVKGTIEKALEINLDPELYGTIAEIGAGQEVARNFFQAGGAAGTVAKTMSAYDMQFSDEIYGEEPDGRYVSKSRVQKMIDREYSLVVERLAKIRPGDTRYFAFANTVAAKGFKSTRDCHGWLGIKYQLKPGDEPVEIVLHVRMHDNVNTQQQVALGILGVNLIYGAFYLHHSPEELIDSLLDNVGNERLEIDMIRFDGPGFAYLDNRLMALQLIRSKLTRSVFFTPSGETIQPSDLLYKKNLLLLRGSFRPITNVHVDILECGKKELSKNVEITDINLVMITEISMAKLFNEGNFDDRDFLGRIDILCQLGYNVQISNFVRYFHLKEYLDQFTSKRVAIVLGTRKLQQIFAAKNYKDIKGGVLEAIGVLFSGDSCLYVYPRLRKAGNFVSVDDLTVDDEVKYLFRHFIYNKKVINMSEFDNATLSVDTSHVEDEIKNGSEKWHNVVPQSIISEIIDRKLFGFGSNSESN